MNVMTSEHGVVTEAGSVRFERLLPGPIERVWAYLVDPDKRRLWLADGAMDARPGGEFGIAPDIFERAAGWCTIGTRMARRRTR